MRNQQKPDYRKNKNCSKSRLLYNNLDSYLISNGKRRADYPDTIIIDAKSGTSGAGRGAKVANLFCEVNESMKAYGVGTHRHTPEIEEQLGYASVEMI